MIGSVSLDSVHAHARQLAAVGGPHTPADPQALSDFAVSGPAEIYATTRAAAARGGSVLMSSGGTTGQPKLTWVPHGMGLERLMRTWRPLHTGNVLLNLFNAGRMWGSHYYMQTLAEKSHCTVIPTGPYAPDQIERWLPMLRQVGVDALAGTPTGLADFADGLLRAGSPGILPVTTVIWMGEPWTGTKRDRVGHAFPRAGLWGNYGSVETWVMAVNRPGCQGDVLHLLPDQVLEPDPDGALLTRAGTGWTVATVRYRLGDLVEPADCQCGRPDGLRVTGRADDAISVRSAQFLASELLDAARRTPGVTDAQLHLTRADTPKAASALAVVFTGDATPDAVCDQLTGEFYHLDAVARQYPGSVTARRTPALTRIDRTNKVPAVIWQDSHSAD